MLDYDHLTNGEFCRTLRLEDLSTIVKVAERFIEIRCGLDAPLWEKEAAYNEWTMRPYRPEEWGRVKAVKKKNESTVTRTGCVYSTLPVHATLV